LKRTRAGEADKITNQGCPHPSNTISTYERAAAAAAAAEQQQQQQ